MATDRLIREAIRDDLGWTLDAHFTVERSTSGFDLVYEARYGRRGAPDAGNTDYGPGLRILMSRLGRLGAIILDATVDSGYTRALPHDQRVLDLGIRFPVAIDAHDPEELRTRLGRAQSVIGRKPGARGGGNSTRRLGLRVMLPDETLDPAALAYLLATGLPGEVAEAAAAVEAIAGRGGGQGFSTSAGDRAIIERWGMTIVALALQEEGWPEVEDVSRRESYDLLCRRAEGELRVEVKATRGSDSRVLVTRAEVQHAQAHTVHLAIVAGIRLTSEDGRRTVASGGSITWHRPWVPRPVELSPIAYMWDATVGIPRQDSGSG